MNPWYLEMVIPDLLKLISTLEREKRIEKEKVASLLENEISERNQSIEFKDKLICIKNQLLKENNSLNSFYLLPA